MLMTFLREELTIFLEGILTSCRYLISWERYLGSGLENQPKAELAKSFGKHACDFPQRYAYDFQELLNGFPRGSIPYEYSENIPPKNFAAPVPVENIPEMFLKNRSWGFFLHGTSEPFPRGLSPRGF